LRTCSGGVIARRVSVVSSHHRSCLSATHMLWASGSLVKVLCTQRWVENLLRIRLIATSHVFEYVGMFRVKVKPIGVNGMVSSFSSCPQKRPAACETTAIPARASRIRPRPAFTTTHSRALVPIYFDIISSLPLFQTDQFSLATAPIINNNRAHTATALNHPHNHVYRRLPESGLGRGV
jgi:hypothetical protein